MSLLTTTRRRTGGAGGGEVRVRIRCRCCRRLTRAFPTQEQAERALAAHVRRCHDTETVASMERSIGKITRADFVALMSRMMAMRATSPSAKRPRRRRYGYDGQPSFGLA